MVAELHATTVSCDKAERSTARPPVVRRATTTRLFFGPSFSSN